MKKTAKLEHRPLHCPICGKRFMNMFGQPLPNHAQIRCMTTDGNEMDLGVCEKCVDKGVTMEMCHSILEGIKDFWIYEIDENKTLRKDDKDKRKKFHNSHKIEKVVRFVNTGKEAEKDARKKGKLA